MVESKYAKFKKLVADTRLLSPLVRHFLDFIVETAPTALDPYTTADPASAGRCA